MAHDFARQRAARNGRSGRNAPAPWAWLLSGIVIGATFSFLVCLAMLKPPTLTDDGPGQADAKPAVTVQPRRPPAAETNPQGRPEPEPAPTARPQFDFYDILRDNHAAPAGAARDAENPETARSTVEVPEPATTPATTTATTAPPTPVQAPSAPAAPSAAVQPVQMVLQAGAFTRSADADRRRGDLLLLGYDARTETVRLPDGQTRYRVLVGPFADQQAQAAARRALRDVGIETL